MVITEVILLDILLVSIILSVPNDNSSNATEVVLRIDGLDRYTKD